MELLASDVALFNQEREEDKLRSIEYYVSILCKCRRDRDSASGNRLHLHLCRNGLEKHKELGNYLIPMLVRCGEFRYAHHLLHKLSYRNELSWSAVIQGSVELEKFDLSFNLFDGMIQDHVHPSKFTYIALLKACSANAFLKRGWEMHAGVVKSELEQDPFVASSLMDMYCSCDLPSEAVSVFEDAPVRDVALWNSFIVAHGDSSSAMDPQACLKKMHSEGLSPDDVTYLGCLKICKSLDNVCAIHAEIAREGYENEVFIGNSLAGAYAKYGSLSEALEVCQGLTAGDATSWNVMLAGCLEQGLFSEVLTYFKMMQTKDVACDHVSYIHVLKACTSLKAMEESLALHTEIVLEGFEREFFLASALVDAYGKLGALSEAKDTLYEMPIQNVVSWTALLGGLVEHEEHDEALRSLATMQSKGISPNCSTMICCLRACGSSGDIGMGLHLHGEIVKKGYDIDVFVGNALIDTYSRCGSLDNALSVFSTLSNRDVVSWTSLMTAYAEKGLAQDAIRCLRSMQLEGIVPDIVAWNAVISSYSELEETEKALEFFSQVLEQGLLPILSTFAGILHGCSSKASLRHGRRIHSLILRLDQAEVIEIGLATTLVDMYSKCGSMVEAEQVFDSMPSRSLIAWNALLTGYVRKGESTLAFQLFDRMIDEGIKPDETAFLTVLTLCTHVGLVGKGLDYFEAMMFRYYMVPTQKHYNCLLDLLGRAGQLHEALLMFAKMSSPPDLATWNTFLGACQKWGETDLSQQAFQFSNGLDMPQGASFVLLSNICADTGAQKNSKVAKF